MLELDVINDDGQKIVLQFEHSLLSLSKWEQDHKFPFMSNRRTKTPSEMIDYYQAMLLGNQDKTLVYLLKPEQLEALTNYINDAATASSVPAEDKPEGQNQETITSELIYYWLTELGIPFSPTETWHVNRIVMLVQITNFKRQPPKKRKPADVMRDWAAQNEKQKKMLGISG